MSNLRDQFEEKYKQMYSTDECILMQNGNYSGWFKQACWDMWQAQHIESQSRIDELEKQLSMMKYINDAQNKNLTNAFKTIEVQQKIDANSQGEIDHLTKMNNRYLGKMQEQQDMIASAKAVIKKHDRYIPHSTVEALEKALQGDL